jgi:replicative DNA helicase
MGKSWFACYLANYIATNEKKPVVFFSAEMSRKQMLYRDEYYNTESSDDGVMKVIVSKNRNGSTGTCKVLFEPSIGTFSNYTS